MLTEEEIRSLGGLTERVLNALRDLSSSRALVIREGCERRIAGREVRGAISSFLPKGIASRPTASCSGRPTCAWTRRSSPREGDDVRGRRAPDH
jgi:hypothetical protein